jgi:ribonuclease HI
MCGRMPWIKRKLRGNKVFVRVDSNGEPCKNERGLVEILYKLSASAKIYNASVGNLMPTGNPDDEKPVESADAPEPGAQNGAEAAKPNGAKTAKPKLPAKLPDDAIIIYTDGACSKNPGPMGIGAVIMNGEERQELSEFLGTGTNNIAELTAIERALQEVPPTDRERMVVVHTDSSYSIGILDKGWKAKANAELVARIRHLTTGFSKLRFVKVKGHAGIPENERCDELATSAITNRY